VYIRLYEVNSPRLHTETVHSKMKQALSLLLNTSAISAPG